MTGVIAAAMAALIGAVSVLSTADCSGIIRAGEARIYEQKMKEEASGFLIAIDAGHQGAPNLGQEPIGPGASQTKTKVAGGTRGRTTGVPEYQLTLDVALKLRDALEEKGYEVLMIRETNDVDITNSERAQMANEAEADVFIRLHANGSDSSSANGAMTICQTPSNPYNGEYYEDSRRLSDLVLDAYTEATGIRSERVWETDTMSGINWCTVPVTILEMGYMTNPEEDTKMQDDDFQNTMVEGIVAGIEDYLEEKKPAAEQTNEAAMAAETASTAGTAEIAAEEEPAGDPAAEAERKELTEALMESNAVTAHAVALTSNAANQAVKVTGQSVIAKYKKEVDAPMVKLEKELRDEIGRLGGKWSLYFKRLDTGRVISIDGDKKMIAASLIKLFVAGEFYRQTENGTLKESAYGSKPDSMINVSDNGACNTLINAVGMKNVNAFAKKNGYKQTQLNRRMLEFNGTENYTSARDCGVMLEKVLAGKYVSKHASERILEKGLKAQERRSKIPAGVPSGVKTANKTGELTNVDNDAAIVWSDACTYILCIMSSDTSGRISEIAKLSSMVYKGVGN